MRVPVFALVNPPLPVMLLLSTTLPAPPRVKVPEPPLEPVVSMTSVVELFVSEPVPARPSMAMTRPLRSRVPALPMVRVLAGESAVSLPRVMCRLR